LFNPSNHLIDIQALHQVFANEIFFFFCTPGHVTGTINQKKFPAPTTGASEIGRHESNLAFHGSAWS
jgi:hypothetical protein